MTEYLSVEGMTLAPGVVETIVSIATSEVEGVASVGSYTTSSLRSIVAAKPSSAGVEVQVDADNHLEVAVHIEVYYGYALTEIAEQVRQSVADALLVQVGVDVAYVDVFVDGIRFDG